MNREPYRTPSMILVMLILGACGDQGSTKPVNGPTTPVSPPSPSIEVQAPTAPRPASPKFIERGVDGAGLVVVLGDSASGAAFVKRHGVATIVDDGLIHHLYADASGRQILDLIAHPGGGKETFEEIRLVRASDIQLGSAPTSMSSFKSTSGLHLGMKVDEAIAILGAPLAREPAKAGGETLRYQCSDPQRCPTLADEGMPTYSATLSFEHDDLIAYKFGYDYP